MSNARPLNGVVGANERVVMVVGNYGSGKTEAAVNLALHLAKAGRRVQIADLDIVNPYFRSREARRLMEQHGIRVVVPPGDQAFADLPIILPEIRGMLNPPEGVLTLFDVGGEIYNVCVSCHQLYWQEGASRVTASSAPSSAKPPMKR